MPSARHEYNNVIQAGSPPRSLLSDAVEALRSHLRSPSTEARRLARLGWFFALSGALFALGWLLDGAPPLDRPTGWRKPIVFGLSAGVTTLSLAALRSRGRAMPRWTWAYMLTMSVELALIDMQAGRGVASHFNTATAFDGAVFSLMGAVILGSMLAATVLLVDATRSQREPDLRLSNALATAALIAGTAVGIAIAVHGSAAQVSGGVASRMGAGEWKPVHAIALHGLQLFPIAAWWLRRTSSSMADRVRALWGLGAAWALLLSASFVQLLLRRAPTDPAIPTLVLASLALVVGAASVARSLRAPAEVVS